VFRRAPRSIFKLIAALRSKPGLDIVNVDFPLLTIVFQNDVPARPKADYR
jgi:hypothetical protein